MTGTTITPKQATGNGDIAGFTVTCGICGFQWTTSTEVTAQLEAVEHEAWHTNRKEQ